MARQIWHLLSSEEGPTAVEYAVMVALVVALCLPTIALLGPRVSGKFSAVNFILQTHGS
jgi:pilus assembly protein Flp/PilA